MYIRFGYDITYTFPAHAPLVLQLHTHPSLSRSLRAPERLLVTPQLPIDEYLDAYGNRCTRLHAPPGDLRLRMDSIFKIDAVPDPLALDAAQHPVDDLPSEVLTYLIASRYCEVDRLGSFAWSHFGNTRPGWERVQTVNTWVHEHIKFDYLQARATRTAFEVLEERVGVCRDYTHLAIALCRSLNIPARYATGYLGDIGVPPDAAPMDFSAWFEAYLGGRWHTFDARHDARRIGRIVMAYGRDAADAALTTTFGSHILKNFHVVTEECAARQPFMHPPIAA